MQKSYIKSRHNVSNDECLPYQPEHYTTLALIHVEKHTSTEVISVSKELASKGKIEHKNEEILNHHDNDICYQSKSIIEIFSYDLHAGQGLVLIEGAPGIGKTVLSKEIAFQWASNTLLQHKKLVFLLFLRDPNLKTVNTLEDLIAHVFKVKMFNSLAKYLIKTKGKYITIVLDGYDEMSQELRQNSFITGIINFTVLPECGLVITSRPTASAHLHIKAHCRVEILGFTESNRLNYIHHALQGNNDKIEEVKSFLQTHLTINALCYIPLNMTILLSLFFEQTPYQTKSSSLPETQTEMYEKFIKVTITRFLKKISFAEFSSAADYSVLPEPHNKVFNELSKLAYNALTKDQIVFTRDEIIKVCPHLTMKSDNWNGLGLMKAAHYANDFVSFHFLHFSVQEYMAAYYIALLPDKQQLQLLKNTFWDIHYFNTWIMYVGITNGNNFAWKHYLSGNWFHLSTHLFKSSSISKKLLHNKVKCLHLFQCLIEGSSESIEQLEKSLFKDRTIDLSKQTLSPKDVNIVGYFLLRSINKHWKKIDLSRCNLRDVGCNALCKMFMDKSNREMLKVDEVDFSHNHLPLHTISTLLDVFKTWNTTDAIICGKNNASYTTSKELEYFQEMILHFDAKTIFFHSVSIGQSLFGTNTKQNSLINHLSKSTQFSGLYLNECTWQENSSQNREFINLIKKQKIHKIHIIGKTNTYCINGIAEAVKQTESVYIYDDTLANTEVDKIGNVLLSKAGVSDVALVIGQNKIIGKLHTDKLNTKLSSLEIYHLFSNIKNLCTNPSQPLVNYFKLKQSSCDNNWCFHDMFILLQNNPTQCQLSICLVKDNILLAYNCKCEDITAILYNYPSLKSVYISHCDFYRNATCDELFDLISIQNILSNCYILNGNLEINAIEYICLKLLKKESMKRNYTLILHSIHPSCKITSNIFQDYLADCYHPVMLITNNTVVGSHITNELFSLLLQLQLQLTAWKFWYCDLDYKMLDLINSVQLIKTNCLIELNFAYCCIVGNYKCHFLKNIQCFTCLTRFNVSGFKNVNNIIKETRLFLLHNTQLEELDISNLDLNVENFRALSQSLKKHLNLTKLNISGIGDIVDEDVAVILSNNVKMEELDLSSLKTKDFSKIANSMKMFLCLKKLNISNNKITADIIGDILSHNTKLEHLNISNLSLCLKDFMIFALKMKNILNLKSVDISGNNDSVYASDSASEATDSTNDNYNMGTLFSHNLKLEELNLSYLDLTSKDFINIATLNSLPNLRKLDISNNTIVDDSIDAVITLLSHNVNLNIIDIEIEGIKNVITVAKTLQRKSYLTKINIGCDDLSNDAADAIAAILPKNRNLKEITLEVDEFGFTIEISDGLTIFDILFKTISKQATYTIATLLSNCRLEEIDLEGCEMETADAIILCKGMKHISTLKRLNFSSLNECADAVASNIAEIIANNKQLKNVDIFGNDLRPVSAIKIFNGMKALQHLIKLNVSFNDFTNKFAYEDTDRLADVFAPIISQISHLTTKPVTHTAVQYLASVLHHNPKLQELNINYLDLDSDDTIVILKSMKYLTNLTELDISHNVISNDAAKSLASLLSRNISLQKLCLCSCSLRTEGAIDILNAMRSHSCLIYLDIRENDDIGDEAAVALTTILSSNSLLEFYLPYSIDT